MDVVPVVAVAAGMNPMQFKCLTHICSLYIVRCAQETFIILVILFLFFIFVGRAFPSTFQHDAKVRRFHDRFNIIWSVRLQTVFKPRSFVYTFSCTYRYKYEYILSVIYYCFHYTPWYTCAYSSIQNDADTYYLIIMDVVDSLTLQLYSYLYIYAIYIYHSLYGKWKQWQRRRRLTVIGWSSLLSVYSVRN